MKEVLLERLRLLVAGTLRLNLSTAELARLTRLDAVAGLDSLALLQLVAAIERQFGVTLEPPELRVDFLADLPALAACIARKLPARC
jgi:acyl carrier protein